MEFEAALEHGILLRRYKRFLADIELDDGSRRTIHCPNTGSMKNCANPGDEVWFSTSDNAKRKYPNTWEISRTPIGHFYRHSIREGECHCKRRSGKRA